MMRTIPTQETLTVEFKSDKSRLPDRDLIETVVCLANTDGGDITRQEAIELCRISEDQATHLLRRLSTAKQLKLVGRGRGAYYVKS